MLKNKLILVTGGAGRIGKSFCREILNQDGKLIISDKDSKRGQALQEELSSSDAVFIESDTTDITSIDNLISKGEKTFNRPLDGAIHCAYPTSSGWGSAFEDLDPKNLKEDLYSQLGGAIIFSQRIISHFLENGGGNLIHISSIQGFTSPKFEQYEGTGMISPIEYSAIKAGVISITKYLAKYYKNKDIRINCISPGGILDNQPEAFLKNYSSNCNSKGMLDSEDLIGAMTFLLSDSSKYLNGQNIVVDDGWSL